MKPECLK